MRVTEEMLKTKGKYFKSGARMAVLSTKMDLLGITDISTPRQEKNGTIVWRLPIKYSTHPKFIEVASFATGYVRNQNGGYTNYQLNKRCESEPQYYPVHEWCDKANDYIKTDKFRQYTTRSCVLIPNEIDRLEYLIAYCLKNYYIKNANQVVNGDYVPKWKLENAQNGMVPKWKYDEAMELGKQQDCGHYDRIHDLEDSLESSDYRIKDLERMLDGHKGREKDLEEKLDAMTEDRDDKSDRIYELESQVNGVIEVNKAYNDGYAAGQVDYKGFNDVSVTVNGHRYKVL